MPVGAVDRRPSHAVGVEVEMAAHDRYWMTRGEPVGNLTLELDEAGPSRGPSGRARRPAVASSRAWVPAPEQGVRLEYHVEQLAGKGRELEAILEGAPGVTPGSDRAIEMGSASEVGHARSRAGSPFVDRIDALEEQLHAQRWIRVRGRDNSYGVRAGLRPGLRSDRDFDKGRDAYTPRPFHESHAPLARALRHRCPPLSRTVSRAHSARLPRGPRARARRGAGAHLRGQTHFMGRSGTTERCVRRGVARARRRRWRSGGVDPPQLPAVPDR